MEQLMKDFLNRSKKRNFNILYVQIYKENEQMAEYCRLPVKTRLNVWSVAKPFVAMGAGIAEKEGLLSLTEPIYPVFEEYLPINVPEHIYLITVRDLLTMTSGISKPLFFCDDAGRYQERDWIRYFFHNGDFRHQPGTHFCYSNFNCYILSAMIEQRSGANLLNYLKYRMFHPLGINNPDWTLCPMGHCMAANGLYLTIDELSCFGRMLLNRGRVSGRQLVPESFVRDACSFQFPTSFSEIDNERYGYGYLIRMSPIPDSVLMMGNYGQVCHVDFKNRTVISVMSLEGNNHKLISAELLASILDYYA